jgi:hypothetical protein
MNINLKTGILVAAITLFPLNISSSSATAGILPRRPYTENNRGIGSVSGVSTQNSVALYWSAPDNSFQSIQVCYKKAWALKDKCESHIVIRNYGVFVSEGVINIDGLDENTCYKFAIYGCADVNSMQKSSVVEAQGWVINDKDQVVLVATAFTAIPHDFLPPLATCPS